MLTTEAEAEACHLGTKLRRGPIDVTAQCQLILKKKKKKKTLHSPHGGATVAWRSASGRIDRESIAHSPPSCSVTRQAPCLSHTRPLAGPRRRRPLSLQALPGDVRIARAAELRDHALDTQSQLVGPPERLASPEYAVAKPRAACRAVQAVSRAWLFADAEPWPTRQLGATTPIRGPKCPGSRPKQAGSGRLSGATYLWCRERTDHAFIPLRPPRGPDTAAAPRRPASPRAGRPPRLLAPEPDQLDLEPPLVAVVEQEEHRLARLGKGGAEPGPPDARTPPSAWPRSANSS